MPSIDPHTLYGDFRESQKWRQRLQNKILHKAFNLPVDLADDVNVSNHSIVHRGLGALGVISLVVSLLCGGGGLGAAAFWFLRHAAPAAEQKAGARVRVFWGDQEIKPGTSRESTVGSP